MSTPDDLLRRVPPHNLDAERAVIGGVLIRPELFDAAAEILQAEDFYQERHRILWQGIEALAISRQPIDAVMLTDAIRPHLEAIGGASYIAECAAGVPAPSLTVDYARLVKDKAIQRALIIHGSELASKAYESPASYSPEHTDELLAVAEYELAAIAGRRIQKPEPDKAATLAAVLWKIEHGAQDSIPTGFPTLDRVFGGFDIGHLTMLAARTSKGKTALALQMALNAAKAGFPTAFFGLEQPAEEIWLRALGSEAQMDMFRARRCGYRDGDRERMEETRKLLEELPLEIRYRPSMRPRDLRLECRRLARDMGQPIRLVVVDYFNLMRGDRRERERWREMQEALLGLKEIAGELGLPILLLSQLNRDTDEKMPPSLANLRDTGATEEHASNVLFIWQRPSEKNVAPVYDAWEPVEVIIGKQRNGPAGLNVPMDFRKSWGAFAAR